MFLRALFRPLRPLSSDVWTLPPSMFFPREGGQQQQRLWAAVERLERQYGEVLQQVASDAESGRRMASLGTLVVAAETLRGTWGEVQAIAEMQQEEQQQEEDMQGFLASERERLLQELSLQEERLLDLLLGEHEREEAAAAPTNNNKVILEVHAGVGGDEAALFAADLFRMYIKYAELQPGWKVDIISCSPTEVGGLRDASVRIHGENVGERLRFESGVHRVQRVPATESKGRLHTSACSVAAFPEMELVDSGIDMKDVRIDTYRAGGAGGQHVNCTDSAVRVTHIPTKTVVAIQDERSQHSNKAKALALLASRVHQAQVSAFEQSRRSTRSALLGSGDRSERIRTYNIPQDRCTDHRIGVSIPVNDMLRTGVGLDPLLDALQDYARRERIEEFLRHQQEQQSQQQ